MTWPLHSFSFRSNFTDKSDRNESAAVTMEQIGKVKAERVSSRRDVIPSACILGKATPLPNMALFLLIRQYDSHREKLRLRDNHFWTRLCKQLNWTQPDPHSPNNCGGILSSPDPLHFPNTLRTVRCRKSTSPMGKQSELSSNPSQFPHL